MSTESDDSFGQVNSAAFAQGLQELGWEIGSNIRIDYRWGAGDTERFRKYAAELVGLSPDVILGTAASIVRALQEASRTVGQKIVPVNASNDHEIDAAFASIAQAEGQGKPDIWKKPPEEKWRQGRDASKT